MFFCLDICRPIRHRATCRATLSGVAWCLGPGGEPNRASYELSATPVIGETPKRLLFCVKLLA